MDVYTVGHSTNSQTEFLKLLAYEKIDYIADIRAFPHSRKHPHFDIEQMSEWLEDSHITYRHHPLLGGRKSTSSVVGSNLNDGWHNQSFHNYADYTLTDEFMEGMQEIKAIADDYKVACMCSERHPARCHRLIISNWMAANGWDVHHLIYDKDAPQVVEHELGKWGAMPIIEEDGTVVYPAET
ncbi:DUF488 domain-containing protein [Salinicoccus jeotgali]|uniref:DUF488 domain-containing protein n=1 Tax=Salinicoccus jeotgali TaxID=381634 RepID=A0ABP7E5J3_9STAP